MSEEFNGLGLSSFKEYVRKLGVSTQIFRQSLRSRSAPTLSQEVYAACFPSLFEIYITSGFK